ncbi:MAG TPA: hypothetical protein VN455_01675 [Methanotrichaceae archaeon]|nr:hypothetical protein [Methanotrichaceae archaeon]
MDARTWPKGADMKKILVPACMAIIVLAMSLAGAMLPSPNFDLNQKSTFAKAGSFTLSPAPSINLGAIDIGQAASGNSMPVMLTANVTHFLSASKTTEAICGLEMFNFNIDTLEVPPGGKAARIMSVSPTYSSVMYAPASCSYLISIIPITDYLNSGSPNKPSPAKQNTWANGVYTLSLAYLDGGNEIASKTFSFTIGSSTSLADASKFNEVVEINPNLSPLDLDPINQLNPQPEPPKPINPFLIGRGTTTVSPARAV